MPFESYGYSCKLILVVVILNYLQNFMPFSEFHINIYNYIFFALKAAHGRVFLTLRLERGRQFSPPKLSSNLAARVKSPADVSPAPLISHVHTRRGGCPAARVSTSIAGVRQRALGYPLPSIAPSGGVSLPQIPIYRPPPPPPSHPLTGPRRLPRGTRRCGPD